MSKRVYKIESTTGKKWLVQGTSQGQALRKVTDGLFTVKAATPQEVMDGMTEGWEMIKDNKEATVERTERTESSTGA